MFPRGLVVAVDGLGGRKEERNEGNPPFHISGYATGLWVLCSTAHAKHA